MAHSIYDKIWNLSGSLKERPENYSKLQEFTQELISFYNDQGRIDENPFNPTMDRVLSLPDSIIGNKINDSICLVTGGLGCVGNVLVKNLLQFNPAKIIIIDRAARNEKNIGHKNLIYYQCDINDENCLNKIFDLHRPEHVFHLAAQRNPGYAENHVLETVLTNVVGTHNVILACEKIGSVKNCIFSSTGKSSRYFTREIYAATKKVCEYLFDSYAAFSQINYSMARFTHVLDNSLMNDELRSLTGKSYIGIHSPGKYVTAQNAGEAASLLLNCLCNQNSKRSKFVIVKNLEWPVESLQVALFYLKEAKSRLPIVFKGNPPGYCEKFFRGQLDWSKPQDLNLLINVYENRKATENAAGDIICSEILPTDFEVLEQAIVNLRKVDKEQTAKENLIFWLQKLVISALKHADNADTINILKWGLSDQALEAEHASSSDYNYLVPLLNGSLKHLNQFESDWNTSMHENLIPTN